MRRLLGSIIAILLFTSVASAQVSVVDTKTNSGTTVSSLTLTSLAVSGSNRYIGVCVTWGTSQTVSTVVFNSSESLTAKAAATVYPTGRSSQYWELVAPSVATANVVITFTGSVSVGASAGALALSGVDQSTPSDTLQTQATNVPTDGQPSLDVTSETDDLVIDCLLDDNGGSQAVGGGQTQVYNVNTGGVYGGMSREAGAATTTMSWSGLDAFAGYSHIAININQATASPTPTSHRRIQ